MNNEFILDHEPLRDQLLGSYAEKVRHIIARAALLNELRFDEQVNDLFHTMSEETGIQAVRVIAVEAKNNLAFIVGIEPTLVFKTKEWPKLKTKKKEREVVKAGSQFLKAWNDFEIEIDIRVGTVTKRLMRLTRDEWNLPFAWLPLELLHVFLNAEVGTVLGTQFRITYSLRGPMIKEPMMFSAGTPIAAIIAQLQDLQELAAHGLPRPRFQEPAKEIIKRNVRWFHRHKIKGETISALAREYHDSEHPTKPQCNGDRSTVQSGIKEAGRILALTPFYLPTAPAEN